MAMGGSSKIKGHVDMCKQVERETGVNAGEGIRDGEKGP